MNYWLNILSNDENNTTALFWLANNNDKNQQYYIEKGLLIEQHLLNTHEGNSMFFESNNML
jgi:hypothetical protein